MLFFDASFNWSKLFMPVFVSLRRAGRQLKHREWVAGGERLFKSFIKKLIEVLLVLL